jgi:hypothetical protein
MIFFFGQGRLGNQLFQYAFIKSATPRGEQIITYNFGDFLELFDSISGINNVRNRYLKFILNHFVIKLLGVMSRIRLISSCTVDKNCQGDFQVEGTTYSMVQGLFPICFFPPCFAQSEQFFVPAAVSDLRIKDKYVDEATAFLQLLPKGHNNVFVHVRRGDYIHETILGVKGTTLPLSYYKKQIEWFENNIEKPFFIFLTDDSEFVVNCFNETTNKVISDESMFVDFTIMTLCEFGILSNSSFSWWGAYLMTNKKKLFAPQYWLGYKSSIELPCGIHPNFTEIVPVR